MKANIQEEIEDKIIDCINLGVAGRLIIFKPEKNNFGADLAVERRGNYKGKEVYIKVVSLVGPVKDDSFVKDFAQKDFKTDKNFYLLFVYFDGVKQRINDYIWLVPSLDLSDLAKVIKMDNDGKSYLRFQAPLDVRNKNQYSKFLIESNNLGKTIMSALEKGGKFDFKEIDIGEVKDVSMDNLKDFLAEARKNTYAANSPGIDNPRLLSSKQLEFQKAGYFYRDVYFSGNKTFIGQEIIYQDSQSTGNLRPIWGMNYIGNNIGDLQTKFLKESLFKLAEKCRMGGVCEYERREYKYQDYGQGNLAEFSGTEEIFLDGKNMYKMSYQGGLISDKI